MRSALGWQIPQSVPPRTTGSACHSAYQLGAELLQAVFRFRKGGVRIMERKVLSRSGTNENDDANFGLLKSRYRDELLNTQI